MNPIIYQPAASDQERTEFTDWLLRNKLTLAKYDSDELAHMAVLCGFPMPLVCEVLSHWVSDRESQCSYSTRESWYVDRELRVAEEVLCDKPSLQENWIRLWKYDNGYDQED